MHRRRDPPFFIATTNAATSVPNELNGDQLVEMCIDFGHTLGDIFRVGSLTGTPSS